MALTDLHVMGPALIAVGTSGSASVTSFGYTEDGARIEIMHRHYDIATDDYGGEGSAPGDVGILLPEARVSLPMIRWDKATMDIVESAIRSRTGGTITATDIGRLVIAGTAYMTLKITGAARTNMTAEPSWYFPCAFPVDAIPFNVGTKVSRLQLTFRCLPLNGATLYQRGT